MRVAAPRPLCFEVVAAAGKTIEVRSDSERVVEFETAHGGRAIRTVELVRLTPPERIDYRWIEGPLPAVEETIFFEEAGPRETALVYTGRFAPGRGARAWLVGPFFVRRSFNRLVAEHLETAKDVAERRAQRSLVYPRG